MCIRDSTHTHTKVSSRYPSHANKSPFQRFPTKTSPISMSKSEEFSCGGIGACKVQDLCLRFCPHVDVLAENCYKVITRTVTTPWQLLPTATRCKYTHLCCITTKKWCVFSKWKPFLGLPIFLSTEVCVRTTRTVQGIVYCRSACVQNAENRDSIFEHTGRYREFWKTAISQQSDL